MSAISKIQTVSECDEITEFLTDKKNKSQFQKTEVGYQQGNAVKNTDKVNSKILIAQAELTSAINTIPTLPEGPAKEEYKRKKIRLENELEELGFDLADFGAVPLFKKELEADFTDARLAIIEARLGEVAARKTVLAGQ
jgi:hypothetical protein